MAAHSKYKKAYTKQLLNGLRSDGKSIEEVCMLWGISAEAYAGWRKAHPEFEEAHQQGDRDKRSWWYKIQRETAAKGNAAVINFALKNENGYVDKTEVHNTHEEQVTTLRIEIHKPFQDTGRIIDGVADMPNAESSKLLQSTTES